MSKYVSVKEFARQAGVSAQAVYKQLDNKLKNYWQVENGKKVISLEGLSVFSSPASSTNKENNDTTKMVQMLFDQLEKKDEQIAALQEALKNAQQLADQAQRLQLATEQQMALLQAPKRRWWQRKKDDEEQV